MRQRSARVPTRERILNQAELLIARQGVYGFKLQDLAERLDLKVPALYKHYTSRDHLLVEVSRRFVTLLGRQFEDVPRADPAAALRCGINRFVEFKMRHPAYVRLALVDFATPGGGAEYVKLAAGGPFEENFSNGPLASMHRRLRALLTAGARGGQFRRVDATDFYRVIESAVLIRLVFPDDALLLRAPRPTDVRSVQRWLWSVAAGFLAPRSKGTRAS